MKTLTSRRALWIAREFHPIIYQNLERIEDMITPIYLGDKKAIISDFLEKPTLYFSVKHDKDYYYILYCVFHRNDWSKLPFPLKSLDEHEFDFEGMLLVVRKGFKFIDKVVTVFHSELKKYEHIINMPETAVVIESGGHGIKLGIGEPKGNYIKYSDCALVNINNKKMHKWLFGELKKLFNKHGVHTPDQWSHRGKNKGDIYRRPDKLIEALFGKSRRGF